MTKKYRTYNSASKNRRRDEVTVYDETDKSWKNIKSAYSKIRRRFRW